MALPPDPFNGRISQDELATYRGDLLAAVIDMTQPPRRRNKKLPLSLIVDAAQAAQDRNHEWTGGWDGGGSPVAAGSELRFKTSFALQLAEIAILAEQNTTAEVDIWVKTFATDVADQPTVADTICPTPPAMTAAAGYSNTALTGINVDIPANSTVVIHLNSNDLAELLSVTLWLIEPAG